MGKATSTSQPAEFTFREPQPLIAWLSQRTLFVLLVLMLAACPLVAGTAQPWMTGCMAAFVGVAAALWAVRILVERELRLVLSPIGVPLLVAAVYVVVRYAVAELEPVARREMILLVTALIFYFLLLNNIRHRWQISLLVWVWIAVGAFLGLQGVMQVLTTEDRSWYLAQPAEVTGRATGTFGDPNHYAAYLALMFPLAAANFFFSRRSQTQKVLIGIACLLIGGGLLASRSFYGWFAWLGSGIVGAMYLVRTRGKKLRWAMVGLGVLGALVLMTTIVIYVAHERAGATLPDHPQQILPEWRSAMQMARRHPLLGVGSGMFQWHYPTRRFAQGHPEFVRNEYLNLFAEYGLVGIAISAWIVVAFMAGGARILAKRASRYSASTPSNRYAFGVGGLAAVAAILLHSMFDHALHVPAILFTAVAITATVMNCGLHQRSGGNDEGERDAGIFTPMRVPGFTRWVLAAALGAGLLAVVPSWGRTYAAEFCLWLGNCQKEKIDWLEAQQQYERAWAFDSRNFRVAAALGDLWSVRATWDVDDRDAHSRQALEWYKSALNLNPYAHDLQVRCGRLYDALGKRKQAADFYERAVHADPYNAVYHIQYGLHHQRWGATSEAVGSLEQARELTGADPVIDTLLARLAKPVE